MIYLNPFHLLGIESLEPNVIYAAYRRKKESVEQAKEKAITYRGMLIDERTLIGIYEELQDPVRSKYHLLIYNDADLLDFLELGDLHFLESDRRHDPAYRTPGFLEFVAPYFYRRYEQLIRESYHKSDAYTYHLLQQNFHFVQSDQHPRLFESIRAHLEQIQQRVDGYSESLNRKHSIEEVLYPEPAEIYQYTTEGWKIHMLSSLPDTFDQFRISLAVNILSITDYIYLRFPYEKQVCSDLLKLSGQLTKAVQAPLPETYSQSYQALAQNIRQRNIEELDFINLKINDKIEELKALSARTDLSTVPVAELIREIRIILAFFLERKWDYKIAYLADSLYFQLIEMAIGYWQQSFNFAGFRQICSLILDIKDNQSEATEASPNQLSSKQDAPKNVPEAFYRQYRILRQLLNYFSTQATRKSEEINSYDGSLLPLVAGFFSTPFTDCLLSSFRPHEKNSLFDDLAEYLQKVQEEHVLEVDVFFRQIEPSFAGALELRLLKRNVVAKRPESAATSQRQDRKEPRKMFSDGIRRRLSTLLDKIIPPENRTALQPLLNRLKQWNLISDASIVGLTLGAIYLTIGLFGGYFFIYFLFIHDFSSAMAPAEAPSYGSILYQNKFEEQEFVKRQNEFAGNHLNTGEQPYRKCFGDGIYESAPGNSLQISNDSDLDVIVCLFDPKTRVAIRHVYIETQDQYLITALPPGSFRMRCYFGNDWNPLLPTECDPGAKENGGFYGVWSYKIFPDTSAFLTFEQNTVKALELESDAVDEYRDIFGSTFFNLKSPKVAY